MGVEKVHKKEIPGLPKKPHSDQTRSWSLFLTLHPLCLKSSVSTFVPCLTQNTACLDDLVRMFSRDLSIICPQICELSLNGTLQFPTGTPAMTQINCASADGVQHTFPLYTITSNGVKYSVVYSEDTVCWKPLPSFPGPLGACNDPEKACMGTPVKRNNKLRVFGWTTNLPIPGFPGILVSSLRYYKGTKGQFLSCIFRGDASNDVNVEIIYHFKEAQ